MQDLKIAIIQSDTVWENPKANISNCERITQALDVDLIVLPETFSTGFTMSNRELSETMDGPTVHWMKATARAQKAVVTGSVIIRQGAQIFNRLVWATPDGEIQHYDKRHLFGLLKEDAHYAAGVERKIFTLNGWRVCPQICYDLRFPVWCRNNDDYDLLLFVANWPAARAYAWKTLCHARAIENQSYLIAANRVGKDGNGLEFGGGSLAIDPLGKTILELDSNENKGIVHFKIADLLTIRDQFPFLKDRDTFTLSS